MDNKEKALDLLEQIIEKAVREDFKHKMNMISKNKGSQAAGESWTIYHLKVLKELIK